MNTDRLLGVSGSGFRSSPLLELAQTSLPTPVIPPSRLPIANRCVKPPQFHRNQAVPDHLQTAAISSAGKFLRDNYGFSGNTNEAKLFINTSGQWVLFDHSGDWGQHLAAVGGPGVSPKRLSTNEYVAEYYFKRGEMVWRENNPCTRGYSPVNPLTRDLTEHRKSLHPARIYVYGQPAREYLLKLDDRNVPRAFIKR
jgi:hypothetical protein